MPENENYTVKFVNKGLQRVTKQCMVFIGKWPLFGGYIVLFKQRRVTEVWSYLQVGLYLEVAFTTSLTVVIIICRLVSLTQFSILFHIDMYKAEYGELIIGHNVT